MVKAKGLDGKDMHSHAPTRAILKTRLWYVELLKHCLVSFSFAHDSSFSTLVISLFNDAMIKYAF